MCTWPPLTSHCLAVSVSFLFFLPYALIALCTRQFNAFNINALWLWHFNSTIKQITSRNSKCMKIMHIVAIRSNALKASQMAGYLQCSKSTASYADAIHLAPTTTRSYSHYHSALYDTHTPTPYHPYTTHIEKHSKSTLRSRIQNDFQLERIKRGRLQTDLKRSNSEVIEMNLYAAIAWLTHRLNVCLSIWLSEWMSAWLTDWLTDCTECIKIEIQAKHKQQQTKGVVVQSGVREGANMQNILQCYWFIRQSTCQA